MKISDDLRFALVTRLVNLRDDSLVQVLKKLEKNEKEIIEIQEKAYQFVKNIGMKNIKLNRFYSSKQSFNSFYREIFIEFTMLVLLCHLLAKLLDSTHNK